MPSPFLYFADDRLSIAELSAACLDGDLVGLGDAFIPADAVETRGLRAGSVTEILGDSLAATHLTAAWIHGALPAPPARHTVQRAVQRRLHRAPDRCVVYRDLAVDPADLEWIGGVQVTTVTRTLADLARVDDVEHRRAVALLAEVSPGAVDDALAWLAASRKLPGGRAAAALLRALGQRQEDVTR